MRYGGLTDVEWTYLEAAAVGAWFVLIAVVASIPEALRNRRTRRLWREYWAERARLHREDLARDQARDE